MAPEHMSIARDILLVLRDEAQNDEREAITSLITAMLGKNSAEYDKALIDILNLISSRNKKNKGFKRL
jgi:hypothetical protein